MDIPTTLSALAVGKFVAGVVLEAAGESSIRASAALDLEAENVVAKKDSNAVLPVDEHVKEKIVSNLVQLASASAARLKSVIVGPSTAKDPLVPMIPSLIREVFKSIPYSPISSSFKFFSVLYINPDTPVPSYFSDRESIVHLAFILPP